MKWQCRDNRRVVDDDYDVDDDDDEDPDLHHHFRYSCTPLSQAEEISVVEQSDPGPR